MEQILENCETILIREVLPYFPHDSSIIKKILEIYKKIECNGQFIYDIELFQALALSLGICEIMVEFKRNGEFWDFCSGGICSFGETHGENKNIYVPNRSINDHELSELIDYLFISGHYYSCFVQQAGDHLEPLMPIISGELKNKKEYIDVMSMLI